MRKTFRSRLNPSKAQRTRLNQTLETCRQVYNSTLALRNEAWEQSSKHLSLYDTNKVLTGWKVDKPELTNVHSQVLQNVQERVDLAYNAFFRRVKAGEKPGLPRFKGFGQYGSFTFKQSGFELKDNHLYLSKIGDVKIKLHRPLEGQVKTLTIQRDSVGNWYACFSCEVEPRPLPPSPFVVGLDVGLTHFATLSTGEKIDNPRFFRTAEKALAKAQRKLDKQAKGTRERIKAKKVVSRIHYRIANQRRDFAHKLSRRLVDEFQIIALEKLEIQEMQDGNYRGMNKSIADAAWGQLRQFTTYKAAWAGRSEVDVAPRGTTQDCSGCGEIVPKSLSVRTHKCPYCGLVLDRDVNAALNILSRGLSGIGNQSVEAPSL